MTPLTTEARRLLRTGRADAPDPRDRDRVRARIHAALVAQAAAALPPAPSPAVGEGLARAATTAAASATLVSTSKTAIIAAVALAIGFSSGLWAGASVGGPAPLHARAALHGRPSIVEERSEPVTGVADPEVAPASPARRESRVEPGAGPAARPSPAPAMRTRDVEARDPSGPASLAAELELLGKAQHALSRGEPQRALDHLDELAADHPNGALRQEWMAARVFALCALDRRDQARAAAARLLTEAPRSVHADRIRTSCAGAQR